MAELADSVDTVITIPNDRLLQTDKDTGFFDSFRMADDILRQAVQALATLSPFPLYQPRFCGCEDRDARHGVCSDGHSDGQRQTIVLRSRHAGHLKPLA